MLHDELEKDPAVFLKQLVPPTATRPEILVEQTAAFFDRIIKFYGAKHVYNHSFLLDFKELSAFTMELVMFSPEEIRMVLVALSVHPHSKAIVSFFLSQLRGKLNETTYEKLISDPLLRDYA